MSDRMIQGNPPARLSTELVCARLHVSYDRGKSRNRAADLGLEQAPSVTDDGQLICGLGTHWRSEEARERTKALGNADARLRTAFGQRFAASPIPGVYVLGDWGDGKALVEELRAEGMVPDGLQVSCMEFAMGIREALPPAEITAWSERVKAQIDKVPLGRTKYAEDDALEALRRLVECPILDEETREEFGRLIGAAKLRAITRLELKRFVSGVEVKVSADPVAPRRVRVEPLEVAEVPQDVGVVRRVGS